MLKPQEVLTKEDFYSFIAELEAEREAKETLREAERKAKDAEREAIARAEREASDKAHQEKMKVLEEIYLKEKAEREKYSKRVDKQLGDLGNKLGDWVQSAIRPNIMELFTDINISDYFENYSYKLDGKVLYETDIVLLNEGALVVVEVKSSPSISDIDEHIVRLGRFIAYPPRHILVDGCKVYGAIAGMILDERVVKYAESKGMYVIKPHFYDICLANKDGFIPKDYRY